MGIKQLVTEHLGWLVYDPRYSRGDTEPRQRTLADQVEIDLQVVTHEARTHQQDLGSYLVELAQSDKPREG